MDSIIIKEMLKSAAKINSFEIVNLLFEIKVKAEKLKYLNVKESNGI